MSVVTSIILCHSCSEKNLDLRPDHTFQIHQAINAFFDGKEGNPRTGFKWLEESCTGGTKAVQAEILVGAFNYFPLDRFIDYLLSLDWEEPQNVQLFVKGEHDEKFQLISLIYDSSEDDS